MRILQIGEIHIRDTKSGCMTLRAIYSAGPNAGI